MRQAEQISVPLIQAHCARCSRAQVIDPIRRRMLERRRLGLPQLSEDIDFMLACSAAGTIGDSPRDRRERWHAIVREAADTLKGSVTFKAQTIARELARSAAGSYARRERPEGLAGQMFDVLMLSEGHPWSWHTINSILLGR